MSQRAQHFLCGEDRRVDDEKEIEKYESVKCIG